MRKSTVVLAFAIPFLYGCKGENEVSNLSNTSESSSTLRCGIGTDIATLDPGKCGDTPSHTVLSQCFEGLTQFNERGETVLNLAKSVDVSKDEKIYTFYLKQGVKFHNGDELTALDFKWTFERNLSKKFNSSTALNFLGDIIGAEEYQKGIASEIKGIKVINPYTLQLQIKKPVGYLLSKFSFPVAYALNCKVTPKTEITKIANVIGTGPFKFLERENKDYNKLVAHSEYHGQKPALKCIEFFVISDPTMMANKVKKGFLDIAEISIEEIDQFKKEKQYGKNILETTNSAVFYLEFNENKSALFKNPKFRLAIAQSINQEELVKETMNGNALPVHYLIPSDVIGYRSGIGTVPFNVAQAKQLLKEANIDPTKINIQITIASRPVHKKIAENISVQLRKNLGIHLDIQTYAWDTYLAKVDKKEIPFRYAGWLLDYPDPSNILSFLFDSKSSQNRCGFNNPLFDSLTRKADDLSDVKERIRLYQKAEDILIEEGHIIPLYTPKRYWWIDPKIKGLSYNSKGHLPYNSVSFKNSSN